MPEMDMIEARLANDFLIWFRRIRKKRNLAGAFDGGCDGALMLCAGSRLAPGANLSFFGYKAAEKIHVFIINFCRFVRAELAYLQSGDEPATVSTTVFLLIHNFITHYKTPNLTRMNLFTFNRGNHVAENVLYETQIGRDRFNRRGV